MVNKLAFLAFFWYFGLAIVKIDICTYIWLYGLKFSLKIGLFEKFCIQCWSKQMTQSPARARNPNTLLRFSRIFNVPSFSLQWIFPWFTNSKRRWYPILLLNKDKWFQWYHSNLNFLAIFSWIWFDQATLCGFWIQSRLQNVRWHLDVCSSDKTPSSLW